MKQPNLFALLTDHVSAALDQAGECDGTFTHTRAWLNTHRPDRAEAGVLYLSADLGARCDCSALRAIHGIPEPETPAH